MNSLLQQTISFFKKKETIDTIKFVVILLAIYIVISLLLAYIPPFNKYNTFSIQTDSMNPIIVPGDLVVTKEINPDELQVGDIMAFYVDFTNDGVDDVVVHYVDEIIPFEDQLVFKTRPHISTLQDSWTIEETDIIGIHMYQVSGVGKLLQFSQSWIGRVVILIDIIVISILYDVLFTKKKTDKESPKEETESNTTQNKTVSD